MILLLIAIMSLCVLGFLAVISSDGYSALEPLGVVTFVLGVMGLIVYSAMAFSYFSAGHKAKIINREFGTEYTQQEVFYAEDVIDTIAEIKRTRIELNGDLMGNK